MCPVYYAANSPLASWYPNAQHRILRQYFLLYNAFYYTMLFIKQYFLLYNTFLLYNAFYYTVILKVDQVSWIGPFGVCSQSLYQNQ